MTQVIIGRWGKNLALRFPGKIVDKLQLHEGDRVEIEAGIGELVIRPVKPKYTLAELFAGKTPEEWRTIYADAYDWGPDVGQEIVEQ